MVVVEVLDLALTFAVLIYFEVSVEPRRIWTGSDLSLQQRACSRACPMCTRDGFVAV